MANHDAQRQAQQAPAPPPLPDFSIAERRAQNGDLTALTEIDADAQLINQPTQMITRWIFTGNGAPIGRFHKVINQLGYQQVHRREVAGDPALSGWGVSPEGFIVRGEKGDHVLVKMPKEVYVRIQHRKTDDRDRRRRSTAAMKQKTVEELEAAGQTRGAQAMASMGVTEFQESGSFEPVKAGS